MKLTTDKAPALIEGPVFCPEDHDGRHEPSMSGALLSFRCWKPNGRAVNLRLALDDYALRSLADLIEKAAQTRDEQAKFLRRQPSRFRS